MEEVGHVATSAEEGGIDVESANVFFDACFGVEVVDVLENALGDCSALVVSCYDVVWVIIGKHTFSHVDQGAPDKVP